MNAIKPPVQGGDRYQDRSPPMRGRLSHRRFIPVTSQSDASHTATTRNDRIFKHLTKLSFPLPLLATRSGFPYFPNFFCVLP